MHTLYDVPAPAKLNLFLHITGRRTDGYHLLQSVFMLIDWCDTLCFERLTSSADIHRSDANASTPLPANDLCVRAAQALQEAGYNAKGYVSEGTAHEFLTWRRSLYEMAPMLFKK